MTVLGHGLCGSADPRSGGGGGFHEWGTFRSKLLARFGCLGEVIMHPVTGGEDHDGDKCCSGSGRGVIGIWSMSVLDSLRMRLAAPVAVWSCRLVVPSPLCCLKSSLQSVPGTICCGGPGGGACSGGGSGG